ncbi:DNA-processing protein DprA [Sphingomonas sp. BK235]|uniref:DNA-processing protein DprA n=1 Tax=Sphingomonas sp. BK235 TaxID=2512131 RepID=UPI00104DD6C5|nr:DNA-processing protein DprA [Sphingomonas sp. BK235]TCP34332.1 DNA protecting protein DprA [Sphingomonas sp. BK235]
MRDEAERAARLRLIRTPSIGPVSYRQLLARFGSAQRAIDALPDLARRGGGRAPAVPPLAAIERERAWVARLGARHLMLGDPDYPALLAALDDSPAVLTLRGDLALAARTSVAIVGARNASAAACRFARELAHDLAAAGASVVSGLARGVDAAAHGGALPATIGVVAGGIDVAYPPEHAGLQERIAREGLLLAEMPPGTEPRARLFPYRNRVVTGLALGTLVVEAAPRSGSLISARLAGEQGREVMAVPGHPSDPRARGCNALIRDGATLVQSAEDVLELLRPLDPRLVRAGGTHWTAPDGPAPHDAPAPLHDARDRAHVLALLGAAPVAIDELVRQSALPAALVQDVLLELELAGRIDRHPGGQVSRVG